MPIERPGVVTPPKFHVENIRKSFQNDKVRLQVIEGLDFDVKEGEFVAIVGPSGCGKTTLMNIIAGFLKAGLGAVNVNGVVRNGPNRKGIMITQQGSVFPVAHREAEPAVWPAGRSAESRSARRRIRGAGRTQGIREQLPARTLRAAC
jgi:ABC-type nitrate/sulfonate/bicarbonate transport system ATPase subunit